MKLYENVSPLGIKPPVNLALSGIVPMYRTDGFTSFRTIFSGTTTN